MELAQALKIGPVKNEAEAASSLASLDIAPHNGWISNSDVTPEVIDELHKAVAAAADSGKLAMSREEALKTFEDLIVSIENQSAKSVPPPVKEPYPAPYSYPGAYAYPYPYPYNYPYPYYYGGFYGAFRPYYYNFRYHRRW